MGMILFDPGLNRTTSLSCVNYPTLAGDAVFNTCFWGYFICDGLEETADFSWWDAYCFDV